MQLNPHLGFDGRCAEAFRFYEKCLRGKILIMVPWGDTPAAGQVPPGWGEKIIHATLVVGDLRLTGCDVPPESYAKPQGISVLLSLDDAEEAERVFNVLADGAVVQMSLQKTFWAQRFGMLTDRFGTPWMINCEQRQ